MGKWRFGIRMKTKISRNPKASTSNRLGYLNEKFHAYRNQSIENLGKSDKHPIETLKQLKTTQNQTLGVTAELQKCNGLLYANITKFR